MVVKNRDDRYNPNKRKALTPQNYTNYYRTVLDVAEDFGSIDMTVYGEEDTKLLIKITKEGIYKRKDNKLYDNFQGKALISKYLSSFNEGFMQFLLQKELLAKYMPVVRLAVLSDDADIICHPITFFLNDKDKGYQYTLMISPGTGNSGAIYTLNGGLLTLDEARALFIKYNSDILFQRKQAIENAQIKRDNENGYKQDATDKKRKEELGIETKELPNGKKIISAQSILGKSSKPRVEPLNKTSLKGLGAPAPDKTEDDIAKEEQIKVNAQIAREQIFGKRKRRG